MALNSNIMAALEQVGLLEDSRLFRSPPIKLLSCTITWRSLPSSATQTMKKSKLPLGQLQHVIMFLCFTRRFKLTVRCGMNREGYCPLHFSRPDLYQLLLSKVPAEKIHHSKKVTSMIQNKEGVMIRCADGTTYHGDILVGADGAHSGVRQGLYQSLKNQNVLHTSDTAELSKGFLAMVGTTDPMDTELYPFLKNKEVSTFSQVIGRGTSFTVSCNLVHSVPYPQGRR